MLGTSQEQFERWACLYMKMLSSWNSSTKSIRRCRTAARLSGSCSVLLLKTDSVYTDWRSIVRFRRSIGVSKRLWVKKKAKWDAAGIRVAATRHAREKRC